MIRFRVCAALLLCSVSVFALAQTNRGSISGTVKDQTGAVIPEAAVTVVNIGTNETRHSKTSDLGAFTVVDLDPVGYKIIVEARGFKKEVIEGVKVDTSSVASVAVTLQTGAMQQEVTVSAQALTVNTESGTTSSTISAREIRDAPLVNRSVLDLALTLPGVSGDAGSENPAIVSVTTCPGCNLSVNGGRPLSTLLMIDGTNNTGVSLARTMISSSPETVQEFNVQTSVFSAEYGGSGGGVISVTTKSGTNQYNGLAMWLNRNPNFAAAPWTQATANRSIPTLKYNQFHGSFGGPVWIPKLYHGKDKTFFFVAFEPNYRRDHLDQYGLVPTDAMRKGDFSGLVNTTNSGWVPANIAAQYAAAAPTAVSGNGDNNIYQNYTLVNGNQFQQIKLASGALYTPFPNNVIPTALLDASAQKALKYIVEPGPYYLDANNHISNIYDPRQLSQDEKRFTLRIDHVFSDKDRINGRYTTSPIVKIQLSPVSPTTAGAEYSYARQAMIAWTHTVSPTMFNDLRINYTHGRFSATASPEYDANTGANLNTELGLPNITKGGVPLLGGLFPGSSPGNGASQGTGLGSGGSTSLEDKEERYALTDIYYWTHGNMSWRFGFDFSRSLQNVIPLFGALGGSYSFAGTQTSSAGTGNGTGAAFASFLLGVPSASATLRNVAVPYYYRWVNYAGFVQNDWRTKHNLTLNIGVRYNLEMPRTEKYNHQGVFDLSRSQVVNLPAPLPLVDGEAIKSTLVPAFAFAGVGGNSKYLTPVDYMAFEPRFGFAWQPKILSDHHLVLRGGYGVSHAPVSGVTRGPNPDFGATAGFPVGGINQTTGAIVVSGTANPNYVMRLGENPPLLSSLSVAQQVGAPSSGVVTNNSLFYQQGIGGYAVSPNFHTPYIQNWNLTLGWQPEKNTTIEVAYIGNKGTHLFLPHENVNPKDIPLISQQLAQNVSTTGNVADPLGRTNPAGTGLQVQNGSLGSPYLGFSSLYLFYDAASNSIRHAGYIDFVHRMPSGLTVKANYTYGKSIDDSSSAGGDKNILTAVGGQVDGQIALGGTRANDRSVSTFDQRHVINLTTLYDLPFGQGRRFGGQMWKPLDYAIGGWSMAGIARWSSGFPMEATLSDTNQRGDVTHTARPDLVPGVPIINPAWNRNCPTGSGCQPYLNPAAFMRPALGALGTAPRTFDSVRGPMGQTFDLSVQKNFGIGAEGKRRVQFRVDFLNLLNHPVFRTFPNNAGGTDLMGQPILTDPTAGSGTNEFNSWATANGLPLSTAACATQSTAAGVNNCNASNTAGDAIFRQVRDSIDAFRPKLQPGQGACTPALAGTSNCLGGLPLSFFSVKLPSNFFATTLPTSYDIRNIDGYKLYRLRQTWNNGGGDLYQSGSSRYIQFGIKFYF